MTIIDTAIVLYEEFERPLSTADKDRVFEELPRLAAMFGIPKSALATDWAGHQAYMKAMYEGPRTQVTENGRRAAASVLTPPDKPLKLHLPGLRVLRNLSPERIAFRAMRAMTLSWLPSQLREAYGVRWDRSAQRKAKVLRYLLRPAIRLQPREARRAQGYLDARRRLGLPALP
jgi:uncharacterized protein (DUF2236 family)